MNRSFWFLPSLLAVLLAPTDAWEASVSQNVGIAVTAATQQVGLSPTSLTFASQTTGTSSTAQAITATNTGAVSFSLSSVAITGTNSGDFSQTNTCPSSLAVSASVGINACQIGVVFKPTATGTRTASVVISATGGGTYPATLTGTGATATSIVPAFYVATNGSDSNAGTLAAPFATIAKCQTAMRGSSSIKTCYIRSGTYTYTTSVSSCYGGNQAINMTTSDNGETLSYYPPDGRGSAFITSGGTMDDGICLSGTGITVDGLDIGHFNSYAVASTNINNTIQNNTLHDTTNVNSNGTLFLNGNVRNNVATHNYVYNSSNHGIVAQPNASGDLTGVMISNNFVYNASTNCTDCGAIYIQDIFFSAGLATIANNYVRDIAANTGGPNSKGIYLDDGASGHNVTGNIVEPGTKGWACWQIHGGQNNTFTGNICDENGASVPGGIIFYQTNTAGTTMAGNVFHNNLILTATSSAGNGYTNLDGSPTNLLSVSNNAYYGYGSATPLRTGAVAVGGGDSNPANVNPNFTCGWEYTLPSNSPVYSSPVSFPTQPLEWGTAGFWGPPGFVIPQVGTPPSIPHGC